MSPRIRLLGCSSSMDSGGSERQMWNLLRGVSRELFDPKLYLLYRQGPLLEQLPPDVSVEAYWSRHKPPSISWPGRIHRQQISDLVSIIKRDRIDVIYERLFHMAMIAGPAAKRAKVRRVANIVSPPRSDVPRAEVKFAWLKRRLLATAYRHADRLLCVSQGAADDASAYYRIHRDRFEVVWNPVDLERLDRLSQAEWTASPALASDWNVISVGRLSEEKGHACLLRAVARMIHNASYSEPTHNPSSTRSTRLHLVGDGPLRDSLQRLASELGISENVVFHGYIDNPFPLMAKCQLFVLPSRYEGLPNALLEAMACQIPALATDCPGGIREATQEGTLVRLTEVDQPERMAELMAECRDRPEPWLQRTSLARLRIEDNHSYTGWLRTMESILSEVVRKPTSENNAMQS